MMKTQLVIFFLLLCATAVFGQGDFFNTAARIKLVSYSSDSVSSGYIPNRNHLADMGSMIETIELNETVIKQLRRIFTEPIVDGEQSVVSCYIPRNGIVFLDKKGNQLGYFEICFECRRIESSSRKQNVPNLTNAKFDSLKMLFFRAGIFFGTRAVESPAHFPGKDDSLTRFVNANLITPSEISGKKLHVEVEFVVDSEGSVSNIKGYCDKCSDVVRQAAMAVVGKMKKLEPLELLPGKPLASKVFITFPFGLVDQSFDYSLEHSRRWSIYH